MKKIAAESIFLAALCWLKAVVSSPHCPSPDYLCVTELPKASGTDKYRVHVGAVLPQGSCLSWSLSHPFCKD